MKQHIAEGAIVPWMPIIERRRTGGQGVRVHIHTGDSALTMNYI